MIEPKIHSHIEDCLDDDHPLAFEQVRCAKCGELVHAGNNECMQTWVETGQGNYCVVCWSVLIGCYRTTRYGFVANVLDAPWGLP